MAVGDKQIDPDDLDHFAKRMDQLADDLADAKNPVSRLIKSNPDHGGVIDFPCAGIFASGEGFRKSYVGKINEMAGGFQNLEGLLRSLADASRQVGKRYRTTEQYNNAKAKDVESMLGGTSDPKTSPTSGDPSGNPSSGNENYGAPRPE